MGLLRVFYAPEKLFAELPPKGAWVVPMIATVLVTLLIMTCIVSIISMEGIMRIQMEANPRMAQSGQTAEQMASSMVAKIFTFVIPPVWVAILLLIVAGVLTGLAMMASAQVSFGKVLAVCGYTFFAGGVVGAIMTVVILLAMPDYSGVDLQNLVRLNPTIFLDKETTARPLYSVMSSLDLISFWQIFLIALGLSKAAGKLKLSKALMIVIVPWALYVIGKAGFSLLMPK